MEYAKDTILKVNYTNRIGVLNKMNKGFFKKIKLIFKENKFITITLASMSALILIDFILINIFLNLIITI